MIGTLRLNETSSRTVSRTTSNSDISQGVINTTLPRSTSIQSNNFNRTLNRTISANENHSRIPSRAIVDPINIRFDGNYTITNFQIDFKLLFFYLGINDVNPNTSPRNRETPILTPISSLANRPLPNTPEYEYDIAYDHHLNSSQSGSETYDNVNIRNTFVGSIQINGIDNPRTATINDNSSLDSDQSEEETPIQIYGNSIVGFLNNATIRRKYLG